MRERNIRARFEQFVLPHIGAAYNLARWLTRNDQDAEDVVQEACLRAYRYWSSYHGGDERAWLLRIVRNTGYTCLQQHRAQETLSWDEEILGVTDNRDDPQAMVLREVDHQTLRNALEELPVELCEMIVLRELEELSYKEIAEIVGAPIGTVMSRLSRARRRLQLRVSELVSKESCGEL